MANRPKTERNNKIWEYWQKGYRQASIARMFKMRTSAVSMVIKRRREQEAASDQAIADNMRDLWKHQTSLAD